MIKFIFIIILVRLQLFKQILESQINDIGVAFGLQVRLTIRRTQSYMISEQRTKQLVPLRNKNFKTPSFRQINSHLNYYLPSSGI